MLLWGALQEPGLIGAEGDFVIFHFRASFPVYAKNDVDEA